MNNAAYGKTKKNLRSRVDVRLTRKQQKRLFKMWIKTKLHVAKNI